MVKASADAPNGYRQHNEAWDGRAVKWRSGRLLANYARLEFDPDKRYGWIQKPELRELIARTRSQLTTILRHVPR